MNKYTIKLKPLGGFYFGGERSFKGESADANDESYIVESNYFPQQTALLGMLRFWMLSNDAVLFDSSNLKIMTGVKDQVEMKIGRRSFTLGDGEKEQNFGEIINLGSCFLINAKGEYILPAPLDMGLNVDFSNTQSAIYKGFEVQIPYITYRGNGDERYSAKSEVQECLYNIKTEEVIAYDKIFIEDRRIGIKRNAKTGKVEDNSLYKQIFYRLSEGCEFVFTAQFRSPLAEELNSKIVELGGDSSKFLLTFTDVEQDQAIEYVGLEGANGGKCKAALLSDARIKNINSTIFSISKNCTMRFLQTTVDTQDYYKLKGGSITKSGRISLMSRGSVFYFNSEADRECFIKEIDDDIAMKKIGYNNIQKID